MFIHVHIELSFCKCYLQTVILRVRLNHATDKILFMGLQLIYKGYTLYTVYIYSRTVGFHEDRIVAGVDFGKEMAY